MYIFQYFLNISIIFYIIDSGSGLPCSALERRFAIVKSSMVDGFGRSRPPWLCGKLSRFKFVRNVCGSRATEGLSARASWNSVRHCTNVRVVGVAAGTPRNLCRGSVTCALALIVRDWTPQVRLKPRGVPQACKRVGCSDCASSVANNCAYYRFGSLPFLVISATL